MPTSRELPRWIQAADPSRYYLPAFQEGASVAESNARRSQEAMDAATRQGLAQQEMNLRVQEAEQARLQRQQEIAIAQEYHRQQQALQQQKVEEVRRINEMKIQQAARQYQARQQYSQLVASGVDPITAAFQVPGLNIPGSGMASMANQQAIARRKAAPPPEPIEKGDLIWDGNRWVQKRAAAKPAATLQDEINKKAIDAHYAAIKNADKTLAADPNDQNAIMARAKAQQALGNIARANASGVAAVPTSTATTPPPQPKLFTDKSGRTWSYTGTSKDPLSDRDESHWAPQQQTAPTESPKATAPQSSPTASEPPPPANAWEEIARKAHYDTSGESEQ